MSDITKEKIKEIRSKMGVTQITVSRIVKNRNGGDTFVSMTANFPTDTESVDSLSLKDAKTATHLLGLEVNMRAHEQACAGGIIHSDELEVALKHIKINYAHLLQK